MLPRRPNRSPIPGTVSPGPGCYDISESRDGRREPSFSVGTAKKLITVSKSASVLPGPGAYSPKRKTSLSKGGYIGVSKRAPLHSVPLEKQFEPGPASYAALSKSFD
jgi:hypothetical protein